MHNKYSSSGSSSFGGIGFVGLLTIVFIVLKLTGVINWSWWWVLSPIWISLGLVLLVLIGVLLFVAWREGLFKAMRQYVSEKIDSAKKRFSRPAKK